MIPGTRLPGLRLWSETVGALGWAAPGPQETLQSDQSDHSASAQSTGHSKKPRLSKSHRCQIGCRSIGQLHVISSSSFPVQGFPASLASTTTVPEILKQRFGSFAFLAPPVGVPKVLSTKPYGCSKVCSKGRVCREVA